MTEPTDAEIGALVDQFRWDTTEGRLQLIRAVLAKWGTPPAVAGEPVARGQCPDIVAGHDSRDPDCPVCAALTTAAAVPAASRHSEYPALPEPDATTVGLGAVWNRHSMRDFADHTHALRMQQAAANPAPVNAWQQAIDHELVTAHLGVAGAATLEEARKALHELICWHIDVATDPATNGGKVLVDAAHAPAAPAAQGDALPWLQANDMAALERFAETTDDDESYDIGKEAVQRLAGFGCLRSHGFGKYSITDFGHYVLNDWSLARELPFKSQSERDAARSQAKKGGA